MISNLEHARRATTDTPDVPAQAISDALTRRGWSNPDLTSSKPRNNAVVSILWEQLWEAQQANQPFTFDPAVADGRGALPHASDSDIGDYLFDANADSEVENELRSLSRRRAKVCVSQSWK